MGVLRVFKMDFSLSSVISVTLISILWITQISLSKRLVLRFEEPLVVQKIEEGSQWTPEVFRALSFGHLPLAVDWLLIRFLVSSGHLKALASQHSPAFYDLSLAADLDPAFYELYTAGANLLTVVLNDPIGAKGLLEKGNGFRKRELLTSYPEDFRRRYWFAAWRIPLILAYVNLFELENLPEAARAFREASEVPGSPDYLRSLYERLVKPGGEYEVGLRLLAFMIDSAPGEEARAKLTTKRDSLFVGQFVFHLNHEFLSFLNTLPEYQRKHDLKTSEMNRFFEKFLSETGTQRLDPWGGTIKLDLTGKIVTSTPHERVMGLD